MNKILLGLALALATICSLTACGSDDKNDSIDKNTANKANKSANWSAANQWYINGQERVSKAANISTNNQAGAAKNIILFVGDGMGISTITAARILDG